MGVASLLEIADLFLFKVVSFTGSALAVLADVLRLSDMLARNGGYYHAKINLVEGGLAQWWVSLGHEEIEVWWR